MKHYSVTKPTLGDSAEGSSPVPTPSPAPPAAAAAVAQLLLQDMIVQRVHADEDGGVWIAIAHDGEGYHRGEGYHGRDEHVPEVIFFSNQRGTILYPLIRAEEPVDGQVRASS